MLEMLLWLVIIGVALYVVNAVIPMDGKIKLILNAFVVVLVLIWIMQALGVAPATKWRIGA